MVLWRFTMPNKLLGVDGLIAILKRLGYPDSGTHFGNCVVGRVIAFGHGGPSMAPSGIDALSPREGGWASGPFNGQHPLKRTRIVQDY